MALSDYDGVVVVGGDGTLHECINGLLQRSDWQLAVKQMPVGMVSGGSGTAAIYQRFGKHSGLTNMAFAM